MGASLKITFDKRTTSSSTFYMNTGVDIADPDDLRDCLIVRPGNGVERERLYRVATLSEIGVYPDLPDEIIRFSAASLAGVDSGSGIQAGDIIQISTLPDEWDELGWLSLVEAMVTDVISSTEVEISIAGYLNGFPSYAQDIQYRVFRGITEVSPTASDPVDGVANRAYSESSTYYAAREHVDLFDTEAEASNKFVSLDSEAKALVSEYNADAFTGVYTGEYE